MRGAYVPVSRDLSAITRLAPEVPAEEVGLPSGAVDRIWAAVERLYRTGTQPAIALCVRRKGRVVLDRSIGHARGNAPTDAPDALERYVVTAVPPSRTWKIANTFCASTAFSASP